MRAAEAEELRVIANGLTSRKSRVIPKPNEHDEKPHAHGEQRQSDAESFRRTDKLDRASARPRFETDEHAAQLHDRPPFPLATQSPSWQRHLTRCDASRSEEHTSELQSHSFI